MTEADILATTYKDKCTITRKSGTTKDDSTKQSFQETITVGVDIPCALSSASGGSLNITQGHGNFHSGYTLFCRPEVDIEAGDKLSVNTEAGRLHILWAGRPHTFAGSHTETPLSEEKPT